MDTKALLGVRIKELRKQKGFTQEKLAELAALDVGYISKLEVGRNFPTLGTLEKLATLLGVELYDFFKFNSLENVDFKDEIIKIYDKLNRDKQYTLYKVAKGLEN